MCSARIVLKILTLFPFLSFLANIDAAGKFLKILTSFLIFKLPGKIFMSSAK